MFLARMWKGLCGPVAQSIHWVTSLLQFFQYFHRTGERFTNRIRPVIVIRLDKVRVMRKFFGEYRHTFCKGTASILMYVPLHEVHFFKEALHLFWVVREKTLVHVARIPFE